jgi:hypothetical protein
MGQQTTVESAMSYLETFLAGWVPDTLDLSGDWVVRGLLGPVPVRFLGHRKLFSADGEGHFSGNNRFLGGINTGYYRASIGESQLTPGLQVINIDYDQPRNPWIMRGLTDEVRFVDQDRLLGRGVYRPAGSRWAPRNIFWFSVERG